MKHEAVPDNQRATLLARFAAIITTECEPRPVHIISTALKTGAPNHMIDAQLPNLWR